MSRSQVPNAFEYIEKTYGRKFYAGMRVLALGKPGVVKSADHHVHVKLDTLKHANPYHPTDVEPIAFKVSEPVA